MAGLGLVEEAVEEVEAAVEAEVEDLGLGLDLGQDLGQDPALAVVDSDQPEDPEAEVRGKERLSLAEAVCRHP